MGMLKNLFRRSGADADPADADVGDAAVIQPDAAQARRRDLVQGVLRYSMGKHAIPSDWMECRILSVAAPQGKAGVHVQLIVRQGEESLLKFVLPFQETFWRRLEKVDTKPREWLFSLAWQFDGDHGANGGIVLPAAAEDWCADTQPPEQDTLPPAETPTHTADATGTTEVWIDDTEDQLASDLQALYAIRDAALSEPTVRPPETPPGRPAANPPPR